jgi:alkaline phosphatase D
MGKTAFYSQLGTRSLVVKDTFDLYAKVTFAATGGKSEVCLGEAQEAWLINGIKSSPKTWKLWGNQYCLMPVQVDLSQLPVPTDLSRRFYLSTDQWDGMRNRRDLILKELAPVPNVVAITGDVHAFFAAVPHVNDDPKQRIVELVTSSISSGTYAALLDATVKEDPTLSKVQGVDQLIANMDVLFTTDKYKANPHMGYANSFMNGFVVVELDGAALQATFHMVPGEDAKQSFEGALPTLKSRLKKEVFKINAGEKELYRQMEGAFKRWDATEVKWV